MKLVVSKFGLMVALAMLAALVAGPISANTIYDYDGEDYNGDMELEGNYTVMAGYHVDGNIKITDGTLRVYGSVDGNITQEGWGHVQVCGTVNGNIDEKGDGDVIIGDHNRAESYCPGEADPSVNGNVKEEDAGNVLIWGSVLGNVDEEKDGNLTVGGTGYVSGNVTEKDDGDLNAAGTVMGNQTDD